MKKIIILFMTFLITITCSGVYSFALETNTANIGFEFTSLEEKYISELTKIKNQMGILATNSLNAVINKKDIDPLLKESIYIKTQIRELRISLSQYHKENSGDEEKNPLSLGFLNTLNYYSMSLSFLTLFLNTNLPSEQNEYLENYYFSKASGDQTLLWVKSQF